MATDVMGPEEALRGGERGQSVRRWGPILLYILLCQSECFFITFNFKKKKDCIKMSFISVAEFRARLKLSI